MVFFGGHVTAANLVLIFHRLSDRFLVGAFSTLAAVGQFSVAAEIALNHHERWDGQGYPHGRRGEEIHAHARITALVDVFDALASRRVYREACSLGEVVGVTSWMRSRTLCASFSLLSYALLRRLYSFSKSPPS